MPPWGEVVKIAIYTEREGFALHKFLDGNFAWARPRGFCLSGFALKQKHRCGLLIPTPRKAVCVVPYLLHNLYGEGGIRTLGRVAPTSVFKTDALNRSATSPYSYFNNLTAA